MKLNVPLPGRPHDPVRMFATWAPATLKNTAKKVLIAWTKLRLRLPMTAKAIIVAKRWDGLGGRLHAILNAWSVASALGLEFRFVWPRNAFDELHEPREIFSDAFIDRFEIAESEYFGCIIQPNLKGMNISDAMEFCRTVTVPMIEISECFDVFAFAEESPEAALERFRTGLHEIGWSQAMGTLIEGEKAGGYSAIHIRAGDIVTGGWRQFVPVEKYTPMALVELAIDNLYSHACSPVVVVSDNARYIHHLKNHFNMIRSPGDIVANYVDMTKMQQAFADILILSRAQHLAGPSMSAFSRLAAHLGGIIIRSASELVIEEDAQSWLYERIVHTEEIERSSFLHPLLARDICWFLDVFSDSLALGEQIALTHCAVGHDPNFCGALNRSAAALAQSGNHGASVKASLQAQGIAVMSDRHADPLVESIATSISTQVFSISAQTCGALRLSDQGPLTSIDKDSEGEIDPGSILIRVKRNLERCEALTPFQIHHSDVLLNLRFQISAMVWLSAADDQLHTVAKKIIQYGGGEPLLLSAWRPSGFTILQASGSFPQVLRNLETVTIRIAHAIGNALSSVSAASHSFALGHVDNMTTSPSGLQWVSGWTYDDKAGRTDLAVGYAHNDTIISGGLTFLARPDIATALKDNRALTSGFAFPVPLAVKDVVGDRQSNLRIQAVKGYGIT